MIGCVRVNVQNDDSLSDYRETLSGQGGQPILASQGSLCCATVPWLIVFASRGSERGRTIQLYLQTSPVATASAVRTPQIRAPT